MKSGRTEVGIEFLATKADTIGMVSSFRSVLSLKRRRHARSPVGGCIHRRRDARGLPRSRQRD